MQYRFRCCHSDNCCKTMSVVLGIKGFKTHFTAENGILLSHVFRESSRKCISDTWMPRKKNPASRKVRERDGEREDRIEHKVTGFWQPLKCSSESVAVLETFEERLGDENPLKSIVLENTSTAHVVDWDNDGDWDILLGTSDARVRYFEQFHGVLHERKDEQNPFANVQVFCFNLEQSCVGSWWLNWFP